MVMKREMSASACSMVRNARPSGVNEPVSPNGSDEPSVAVAAVVVGVVAPADVAVVAKLTVAVLDEHKHGPERLAHLEHPASCIVEVVDGTFVATV